MYLTRTPKGSSKDQYTCTNNYNIGLSLGPQPVGVKCPLTSSPGEFPGYWDWLRCPGLPTGLVSNRLFPFAFHISVFFHSFFTCHWISFVFLHYNRHNCA